jgi:hypothetical protein
MGYEVEVVEGQITQAYTPSESFRRARSNSGEEMTC